MSKCKAKLIFYFQVISVKIEDFIKEKVCCRTFITPYISQEYCVSLQTTTAIHLKTL